MKIKKNEPLDKYTTIHIGGTAAEMYVPETVEELIEVVNAYGSEHIIGGGSNLLINNRVFDKVICLREFDKNITSLGNGRFKVGASVRLQQLIRTINDAGYGGIEYLYSVPGLLGGAIVMNAGGSVTQGWSISDHIVSVDVLHNGIVESITKGTCKFSYRQSLFKHDRSYIVLGAILQFDQGDPEGFKKKREERIQYCKEFQDNSKPNFGSVFCVYNQRIAKFARKIKLGDKTVHFSKKTVNWLQNESNGTFKEAISAIKKVEYLHKIFGKQCKREVITWE